VQRRDSSRQLLFDGQMQLCGRRAGRDALPEMVRAVQQPQELAFAGIHAISPRLLPLMKEEGVFSIIDCYLRLAVLEKRFLPSRRRLLLARSRQGKGSGASGAGNGTGSF